MVCVARVASVLIFPWLDRMAGVSFLFTKAPEGGVVAVRSVGEGGSCARAHELRSLTAGAASVPLCGLKNPRRTRTILLHGEQGPKWRPRV